MRSFARRAPHFSFALLALAQLLAASLSGCGKSSEETAVNEFFKNNKNSKREEVAKFSGRVTVDGMAPSRQQSRLFVILSDSEKPEKPGKDGPRRYASCDEQGNFEFTTYVKGDGIPYGKYVVTFVQLHKPTRAGRRGVGFVQEFVGPDDLKNLYNDPQKNRNEKDFVLEVQSPGRTDHEFNLSVAGKDPVATPSEYAVTRMRGNG